MARRKIKRKVIIRNSQSPGDIVMLTAAVRDLFLSHPEIGIDPRTSAGELWENNPHIIKFEEGDKDVEDINVDYPLIHESNEGQHHFIHGYRKDLENKLDVDIKPTKFKGDIHIGDSEKGWISQVEEMGVKNDFWIVMAGGKYDYTCKWSNPTTIQNVIDHFKGKITFVQCGQEDHYHPPLKNVVNLIGKTDLRQFIRLIYHSVGVLCPVTLAMHAAAAVEMKNNPPINRPCVVIAGGREPPQWEAYPNHRFLATNGAMDCCDNGGCWKSRCQTVGDGDKKDIKDLCLYPVELENKIKIPKCMDMIKDVDIIRAIEMYYEGGVLKYNDSKTIVKVEGGVL
jgi:ADP-heptose:LPS heptosyltransferase